MIVAGKVLNVRTVNGRLYNVIYFKTYMYIAL